MAMGCAANYKWAVLFAASVTQFLRGAVISGAQKVYPLHYGQRYGERVVSATIGSVHIAVVYLLALPATILCKRFESRRIQMVGGLLSCIGLLATAYTNQSWQGMLTNILMAVGTAGLLSAPFTVVSKYFPGNQLVPYALLSAALGFGAMCSPLLISFMMATIGFINNFLVSAGIASLSIFAAILYRPPPVEEAEEPRVTNKTGAPFLSLQFKVKRRGIYYVQQEQSLSKSTQQKNSVDESLSERCAADPPSSYSYAGRDKLRECEPG